MAAKPTISPVERAEQLDQQRDMIRAALGAQYPAWLKLHQESAKKRKKKRGF